MLSFCRIVVAADCHSMAVNYWQYASAGATLCCSIDLGYAQSDRVSLRQTQGEAISA